MPFMAQPSSKISQAKSRPKLTSKQKENKIRQQIFQNSVVPEQKLKKISQFNSTQYINSHKPSLSKFKTFQQRTGYK